MGLTFSWVPEGKVNNAHRVPLTIVYGKCLDFLAYKNFFQGQSHQRVS